MLALNPGKIKIPSAADVLHVELFWLFLVIAVETMISLGPWVFVPVRLRLMKSRREAFHLAFNSHITQTRKLQAVNLACRLPYE